MQIIQSNAKVLMLHLGLPVLWKMGTQESWVLWTSSHSFFSLGHGLPCEKEIIENLAVRNAILTSHLISLTPETKEISNKRFFFEECMYKERETWRKKSNNKMWKLEIKWAGDSLSDRPKKREYGHKEHQHSGPCRSLAKAVERRRPEIKMIGWKLFYEKDYQISSPNWLSPSPAWRKTGEVFFVFWFFSPQK